MFFVESKYNRYNFIFSFDCGDGWIFVAGNKCVISPKRISHAYSFSWQHCSSLEILILDSCEESLSLLACQQRIGKCTIMQSHTWSWMFDDVIIQALPSQVVLSLECFKTGSSHCFQKCDRKTQDADFCMTLCLKIWADYYIIVSLLHLFCPLFFSFFLSFSSLVVSSFLSCTICVKPNLFLSISYTSSSSEIGVSFLNSHNIEHLLLLLQCPNLG
jgi:hypothetical protein